MARKATTRGKPYSEEQARADARAALKRLEVAQAQLQETSKRLRALPSWKRVMAAIRKGDDYATGLAWSLGATCEETARRLKEDITNLRNDLRATDASLQVAARKREEHFRAWKAKQAAQPPQPTRAELTQKMAEGLETLAPALRTLKTDRDAGAGAALARVITKFGRALRSIAGDVPKRGRRAPAGRAALRSSEASA